MGHKKWLTAGRRHTATLDVFSGSQLEGSERERTEKWRLPSEAARSLPAQPVPGVIPSIPIPQGLKLPGAVTDHLGKACVSRDSAWLVSELECLGSATCSSHGRMLMRNRLSSVYSVFGYEQKMVAF